MGKILIQWFLANVTATPKGRPQRVTPSPRFGAAPGAPSPAPLRWLESAHRDLRSADPLLILEPTERGRAEMVAPGAAPKRSEGVTVAGALWAERSHQAEG